MGSKKRIAMILGSITALIVLSLFFTTGSSKPNNQKIAKSLLKLHRQWDSNTNIPALYTSMTNLPFHNGGAIIGNGWVSHRYNFLGIKLQQYYFVVPPDEGTLYHNWIWYPPWGGNVALSTRKLQTHGEAGD